MSGELTGLLEPEIVNYGFTCFNCRETIDFQLPRANNHQAAEDLAGAAGWCIGHYKGQGEFVCPDCKTAVWDATLLGAMSSKSALSAQEEKLSPEQKKLARHTLGLDNPDAKGRSYRNRYFASRGHASWNELHAMVGAGYMNLEETPRTSTQTLFSMTHAGALLAIEPGEQLDTEDFP